MCVEWKAVMDRRGGEVEQPINTGSELNLVLWKPLPLQNTLRGLTELSVEDGGFPPCDPVMPPSLSSVLQEHQRELRQHGAPSQPLQRHLRPQGGTQEEARAALLAARRRGPGAGGPEQRAGRALAQGAVRLLWGGWKSAESDQSRWDGGVFTSAFPFLCEQVVQDVGSQCSNTEGVDGSTSPIIQRKLELDKVWDFYFLT